MFRKIILILIMSTSFSAIAGGSFGTLVVEKVNSVYDGDTFRANLTSGHPIISNNIRIRLSGIDTPEIKGKCWREKQLAIKARDHLRKILESGDRIVLKNVKRGKYFRLIADVYVDGKDINKEMIQKKLAYAYLKGRKNDWCSSGFGWIKLK